MNVRTNLLLPAQLLDEVDRFAGPRGRSRYVADALRLALKRDRLMDVARATAGTWTAQEYPEFATPENVVAWVRARRAEVTDPGLETTDAGDAGHDLRDRPSPRRRGGGASVRPTRRGR